ncbi:MAG: DUF6788 family protein [Vicinamibacteraceae bacterium]
MIFGTLAERGRVCGKPTCRCARGEKHPAVQLAHWAGEGRTRSQHVPYAVLDTVRAGVDAWGIAFKRSPASWPTAIARKCGRARAVEARSDDTAEVVWSDAVSRSAVSGKSCCPMPASCGPPSCVASIR